MISHIEHLQEREKTLLDKLSEQQTRSNNLREEDRKAIMESSGKAGLNNSMISALSGLQKASFGTSPLAQELSSTRSDLNDAMRQQEEMEFKQQQAQQDQARWEQEMSLKYGATDGTADISLDDLLKRQKQLSDQGFDTTQIDMQIAALTGGQKLPEESKNAERQRIADLAKEILNSDIRDVVGSVKSGLWWANPNKAKGKTKVAKIDQLVGSLNVEAREKLKGQGAISDPETKMLAEAQSILNSRDIDEESFKRELERIYNQFNTVASSSNGTTIVNSKGQSINNFFK